MDACGAIWLNCAMPRVLFEDVYWTITEDSELRLLRMNRTNAPLERVPELTQHVTLVEGLLRDYPRYGILLDMRAAPLRNDPAFEKAAEDFGRVTRQFRRLAILVQTAVGALQARRMQRERGSNQRVFDDEAKALAYLTGTDA